MAKKKATTCYIECRQDDALRRLSAKTKIPIAELIRQGIDAVLKKHEGDIVEEPDQNDVQTDTL